MIPTDAKTALIPKSNGEWEAIRLDLNQNPCKGFHSYRGIRAPSCGCFPCVERYVNRRIDLGRKVDFSTSTLRELFLGNQ